jgi:hypothetical protein
MNNLDLGYTGREKLEDCDLRCGLDEAEQKDYSAFQVHEGSNRSILRGEVGKVVGTCRRLYGKALSSLAREEGKRHNQKPRFVSFPSDCKERVVLNTST